MYIPTEDNKRKIAEWQAQEMLNACHTMTGDSQVLRRGQGNAEFYNPLNKPIKENCPFNVPIHLVEDYKPIKERKRRDPEQLYETLALQARGGRITKAVLRKTAQKWVESLTIVCAIIKGEKHFFEGRAKSSPRYNKANYWNIHDHAKTLAEWGYKPYFLTVTNDPKPYKYDYIDAWKGFTKENRKMLKNLCKKFGAYYECVNEAQKSGNPHAHIVLWFPEYFTDDKITKAKKKIFISDGTLKNYLRKYEKKLGFMELRRGEDKDPINYLLKYISKATTRDFYAMAKASGKMGDSERKDLLSALMPVIARVRQFSMSRGVLPKEGGTVRTSLSLPNKVHVPIDFKSASEARDYLKTLCTNSPLPCQSLVRILSFKDLPSATAVSVRELTKLSPDKKDEIYNQASCIGCKGCILTHFINYITTGADPWFDLPQSKPVEDLAKKEEEGGLLANYFEEVEAEAEGLHEISDKTNDPLTAEERERINKRVTKRQILAGIMRDSNLIGFSLKTQDSDLSVNSRWIANRRGK